MRGPERASRGIDRDTTNVTSFESATSLERGGLADIRKRTSRGDDKLGRESMRGSSDTQKPT